VPDRNLHLTLVFLGHVGDVVEHRLREGAARVRGKPFLLDFDHAGAFRGSGVAWLAPRAGPAELDNLVAELRALAARCEIATDDRPFRPHMTIARKLHRKPRPSELPPIRWQINDFCLVASMPGESGSEYVVRHTWRLDR